MLVCLNDLTHQLLGHFLLITVLNEIRSSAQKIHTLLNQILVSKLKNSQTRCEFWERFQKHPRCVDLRS